MINVAEATPDGHKVSTRLLLVESLLQEMVIPTRTISSASSATMFSSIPATSLITLPTRLSTAASLLGTTPQTLQVDGGCDYRRRHGEHEVALIAFMLENIGTWVILGATKFCASCYKTAQPSHPPLSLTYQKGRMVGWEV